jgi:hypothetical protein
MVRVTDGTYSDDTEASVEDPRIPQPLPSKSQPTPGNVPGRKEAIMAETGGFDFLAARAEWVAKGRPADESDPYWASVVAAQAAPRPTVVMPLVVVR